MHRLNAVLFAILEGSNKVAGTLVTVQMAIRIIRQLIRWPHALQCTEDRGTFINATLMPANASLDIVL